MPGLGVDDVDYQRIWPARPLHNHVVTRKVCNLLEIARPNKRFWFNRNASKDVGNGVILKSGNMTTAAVRTSRERKCDEHR